MDRQTAINLILDHYESPRHYGRLDAPTFTGEGVNPGCGDVVRLYVRLDDDQRITAITFEGEGCTISQASASLLTEIVHGLPLSTAQSLTAEDLADRLGSEVVASRLPCVSLALRVLKDAAESHAS